ncbi:MAG TPA: ABC transporter ATP-binding protein [Stellaceae bacterium]|nr:ABC transporter ATP-binding protein [Stellaceae bacterium]
MIEARALTARFDTTTAVDGVSFSVASGEAFGIVGESGSGKSTLLRVLAGLHEAWSGALLLDGAPHGRRPAPQGRVQMVFQDPYGSLHPRHSVDRALAEPLAILHIADAAPRIAAALQAVGLEPRHRFRYPHQLSGGQRQRVAIARALILEPALLLLDEPTAALDVSVQAEIIALLQRLRRERRLTYVLVSHNLAIVAQLCERVAVMREGRIVEELTTAELRAGSAQHRYTRDLLTASRGYARRRDSA